MVNHQILEIVNAASNHYAKVKELVAVTAHIKSPWLASFRDLSHVQQSSKSIDNASKHILMKIGWKHVSWVAKTAK
jgi:hypothetical protein